MVPSLDENTNLSGNQSRATLQQQRHLGVAWWLIRQPLDGVRSKLNIRRNIDNDKGLLNKLKRLEFLQDKQ